MRVALIAPVNYLYYQLRTTYQLMLPQMLADGIYKDHYLALKDRGDHIILDNGAAEGIDMSDLELLSFIQMYDPSEIAVPDVLGDADATFDRFCYFFEYLDQTQTRTRERLPLAGRFGIVAQGRDIYEAKTLVSKVMGTKWRSYIGTVFIPRLLVTQEELFARIRLAEMIHQDWQNRLAIHMFGSSPLFLREILAISVQAPFVRGMDTSLPFNVTYSGQSIFTGISGRRPEGYFDIRGLDEELLRRNIESFLEWGKA
jgi:hypothetical protein